MCDLRPVWQAARIMRRAAKGYGISDETVLDVFFSTPALYGKLLTGPYTDEDQVALVEACGRAEGGRILYTPGAFSMLMTSEISEVSRERDLDPADLYRACRCTGFYLTVGDLAAVILHDDDPQWYRRIDEWLVSSYTDSVGSSGRPLSRMPAPVPSIDPHVRSVEESVIQIHPPGSPLIRIYCPLSLSRVPGLICLRRRASNGFRESGGGGNAEQCRPTISLKIGTSDGGAWDYPTPLAR